VIARACKLSEREFGLKFYKLWRAFGMRGARG
jgi:hypothetical protein